MSSARRVFGSFVALLAAALAASAQGWPQWGQNAQHSGSVATVGQRAQQVLADVIYDPFTAQEAAAPPAAPDLRLHYQTPLVAGDDVFMEGKTGSYTGIATWETQIWNERRLHWQGGALSEIWTFQSDWKPVPFGSLSSGRGPLWEPVFHAALAGGFVYVPGAGGTVYQLNQSDGSVVARVNPFGPGVDASVFLTGPITADAGGNVYYDAVKLVTGAQGSAWDNDVVGSWLVKVTAGGGVAKAAYASLVPGAPQAGDPCLGVFSIAELPWPPSPDAVPPTLPCGSVRAGLNLAPAVAPDGTIYVPAVHHFSSRTAYLLAVHPDLTPKWQTSLRDRFNDGCGVYLPPNGSPGGCRVGAHAGVDPAQNRPGAGRIVEDSTASPAVAPDGSILLGTAARYNWSQGHLMKFSPQGQFLAAYTFGWDVTPAIYPHDGTYSVVIKENRYGDRGSYCDDQTLCPPDRTASDPANPEAFFITQLSRDLLPEWRFQNTNTFSCSRDSSGRVSCVSDHPHGFEWCVNAPAVDGSGVVYGSSEDGNLYAISQGGGLRDELFLQLALGAAYTPLAIGGDGKLYTENNGHLFAVAANGPGVACVAGATTLCIDDQPGDARFEVKVQFRTAQGGGLAGDGQAISLASLGLLRGGLFWFFGADNPEMLVKVLNACGLGGKFWVFYSATTNVGLTTTVRDTRTGVTRTYRNPDLTPAPPVEDTAAFDCVAATAAPSATAGPGARTRQAPQASL
jgi:outer membrane protein assembly factor BamB